MRPDGVKIATGARRVGGRAWVAVAGAVLVFAAGLLLSRRPDGHNGAAASELTVALGIANAVCLDPWQNTDAAPLNMIRPTVETLTRLDPRSGRVEPWLAEDWVTADSMTRFTFKIRRGVTFSDGSALTPAVVMQNWQAIVHNIGPSALRAYPYLVDYRSIRVVDADHVEIRFAAPHAGFLNSTANIFQAITAPASLRLSADQRCGLGVLGTGPFAMHSFEPGRKMVLSRRRDYVWWPGWAQQRIDPNIVTILFYFVPEPSARLGMLRSHQVDIAQGLLTQDVPLAQAAGARILVRSLPGIPMRLIVNTKAGVLADSAVRQALQVGIDRAEINSAVYDGRARPATSDLVAGMTGYIDLSKALAHDPDAAQSLLDRAGWRLGPDGIRRRDGQRLATTLTFLNTYPEAQLGAELIQQQLRSIGIDIRLIGPITNAQNVALARTKAYALSYVNATDMDPDILRAQMSTRLANRSMLDPGNRLDRLLDAQAMAPDPQERAMQLADLQASIVREAVDIPVVEIPQVVGVAPAVRNVSLDAEARLMLYDVQKTAR
jgi:peptide/nickel transport system substrate-binding protein